MKHIALACLMLAACQNTIKNNDEPLVEEGTETSGTTRTTVALHEEELTTALKDSLLPQPVEKEIDLAACYGTYVGLFEPDVADVKGYGVGDAFYWDRSNKICLCIEKIDSTRVTGYSIVAGNKRKFTGLVTLQNDKCYVVAKEPGDDKYDGEFDFTLDVYKAEGTWKAFKKIEIDKRKYTLERKDFVYDPEVNVNYARYVDWNKKIKKKVDYGDGEVYFDDAFASSTHLVQEINASAKVLTKKEVENLSKGDLVVIRNAIYARHGYSFKNRPLRVYFDRQDWYIPITNNIQQDFTDIEKKNIELLLRYEKNAKQYYDRFGRG